MKTSFFKCELLSDVVLNASLATEGNMETLDYIPGSNFLGVVANSIYEDNTISEEERYRIIHSGDISFGDAIISNNQCNSVFYPKPFSFFKDKQENDSSIYLHHKIADKEVKNSEGSIIQFKQERSGFINNNYEEIKEVKKTFALKSAQDRSTRSSKESAMFGFESICKGQVFIFSVKYSTNEDIEIISKYLIGEKRLGKSKSAQYGRVKIAPLSENPTKVNEFSEKDFTLVYAESNLCFLDEHSGQSTFSPSVQQLGFKSGTINWNLSSIRTYSYSPWNVKRNSTNTQRDCILKGSVFYIENGEVDPDFNKLAGEYLAEGLGRVLINPSFLSSNTEGALPKLLTEFGLEEESNNKEYKLDESKFKSALGKAVYLIYTGRDAEKEISKNVNAAINSNNDHWELKSNITASQWGNIRALATEFMNHQKNYNEFLQKLGFEKNEGNKVKTNETGLLTHGTMYDRMWNKNGRLEKLKRILDEHSQDNLVFVAKYAAEMAKIFIDIKNGKIKKEKA